MSNFIFSTIWGWVGTAGLIVIACVVVGYLVPTWRPYVIALGVVAISVASAFSKGWRARGVAEQKRQDAAVAKARKEYDKIDAQPDTPADVADRLRLGRF